MICSGPNGTVSKPDNNFAKASSGGGSYLNGACNNHYCVGDRIVNLSSGGDAAIVRGVGLGNNLVIELNSGYASGELRTTYENNVACAQ